jgi:uncharacterized protein (DUF4213/DUF364 family)
VWTLYNELIEAVSEGLTVADVTVGLHWTLVRSSTGALGMAMTMAEPGTRFRHAGTLAGMSLRKLAEGIKSWNLLEASIGLAAINAAQNAPQTVAEVFDLTAPDAVGVNVFDWIRVESRGKRVAVIGHFPNLAAFDAICELSILERRPQPGDLPDPACEYILPYQDIVIATATTLINKTLPRLLQLSQGARVILTGPSVPLSPLLFDHGIAALGGLVVDEPEAIERTARQGGHHELFQQSTRMVILAPEHCRAEARR